MSSEKMNALLIPGIHRLFSKNELTLGSVYATQAYIQINNFQVLLIALREDIFHQLLNRFFLKVHVLAIKYHGYFSIESPDKISIIFGIKKDDVMDNSFFAQKSLFFCDELLKELKYINIWLKECVHTHYNNIRNQYLRLSMEERKKVDINDLKISIHVGIATSEPSSTRDIHHMRMMKIGSEISSSYGAYGGVPYLSRILCRSSQENSILMCENTVRDNEWLFEFKESDQVYADIYGNMRSFVFNRVKSINDIFFVNNFMRDNLTGNEENHINDILSNLYAGHVKYSELQNYGGDIKLTVSEYEQFQGLWMGAKVNGTLVYMVCKLLGYEYEKCISLTIVAAWHYFLKCKNTYLPLTEKFELLPQIPALFKSFDYESILKDIKSKKMESREALIVKTIYDFERNFFSHQFNSTGTLKKDFDRIKAEIVSPGDSFTEELYGLINKVLTD